LKLSVGLPSNLLDIFMPNEGGDDLKRETVESIRVASSVWLAAVIIVRSLVVLPATAAAAAELADIAAVS
jgi:predicted nucleotidyltransferase